jgi:hypothetical protein
VLTDVFLPKIYAGLKRKALLQFFNGEDEDDEKEDEDDEKEDDDNDDEEEDDDDEDE